MKVREALSRLNLIQRSRQFKIGATVLVLALAAFAYGSLWVGATKAQKDGTLQAAPQVDPLQPESSTTFAQIEHVIQTWMISIAEPMTVVDLGIFRFGLSAPLIGAILLTAGAIFIIWLDLALTYLGFSLLGALVAWPMTMFAATETIGQLILAMLPLVMLFALLMQILRGVFAAPIPLFAIARNVLNEAVRMKISVVFIVLLILFLALTPTLLNEDQPLRYRVQQWLQFGTGLSYLVMAMLTVFLSAASVAFEQRDKIIWQTVTKPVPRWQYIMGKWLGVMGLNAVLLIVTASGVYMFTEYLRYQPANGEIMYNVPRSGGDTTLDRRLLESQVLVARVGVVPNRPDISEEEIDNAVDQAIVEMQTRDSAIADTPALRERLRSEEYTELVLKSRSINPGEFKGFTFSGLKDVRDRYIEHYGEFGEKRADSTGEEGPGDVVTDLTFRFKVNAGSNDPGAIYNIMFLLNNEFDVPRNVALKAAQSFNISPNVINADGTLLVEVGNHPSNPRTITFPPDGLELLYVAGGYEMNFARIMGVIWLKLGFIAAVAIAAAAFLSFPVACMVTLVVFFAAESSAFLAESLDMYFATGGRDREYWKVAVSMIGRPITWAFALFSELKPTTNLVDGRLVGWGLVFKSIIVLGAWTLGILGIGLAIFRQRELAIYSGH